MEIFNLSGSNKIFVVTIFLCALLCDNASAKNPHHSESSPSGNSSKEEGGMTPQKCIAELNGNNPKVRIDLSRVMPPLNDQGNNGTCYAQGAGMLLSNFMFSKTSGPQNLKNFDYSPEMILMMLALKNPSFLQSRINHLKTDKNREIFGGGFTDDVLDAVKNNPEVLVPIPFDLLIKKGIFKEPLRSLISSVMFDVNHASNKITLDKAQKRIREGMAKILSKLDSTNVDHKKVLDQFALAGFKIHNGALSVQSTPKKTLGMKIQKVGNRNGYNTNYGSCQQTLDAIFENLCHLRPVEISFVPPSNPFGFHSAVVDGIENVGGVPHVFIRDSAGAGSGAEVLKLPVSKLCGPSGNPKVATMLYRATAIRPE